MSAEQNDSAPTLAAALRSLALPAPPADGWPALKSALTQQQSRARRRRRQFFGLAIAASLGLLAALLPSLFHLPTPTASSPGNSATVAGTGVDRADQLDALITRSAQLEAQLDWLDGNPLGGDALGVDLALIDRLQWIDQLLHADPGSLDTMEVLWRERVELLGRRLALSQRESLIAAAGELPATPTL